MKVCSSCGRNSIECVEFPCPSCAKVRIVRCNDCRKNENKYVCKECGFKGP